MDDKLYTVYFKILTKDSEIVMHENASVYASSFDMAWEYVKESQEIIAEAKGMDVDLVPEMIIVV